MSEIRTGRRAGVRSLDRVAGKALVLDEQVLAALLNSSRRTGGVLSLSGNPGFKFLRRLRHEIEPHVRVLITAKLGALPAKSPFPVGLQPGGRRMAGDEVLLAVKVRHPKAVDHIERAQIELHGATRGDVHFV